MPTQPLAWKTTKKFLTHLTQRRRGPKIVQYTDGQEQIYMCWLNKGTMFDFRDKCTRCRGTAIKADMQAGGIKYLPGSTYLQPAR